MIHTVTVAEGGDPRLPFLRGLRHPEDFIRPWDERPKATIEVDDSDRLGDVLKKSLDALGSAGPKARGSFAFIDFFVEGQPSIKFRHELALIDEDGHVRWTSGWQDEPFSEILRAHEAGVFVGDPYRLYLLRQPGIGNGVLADFPTFIELVRSTWDAIQALGTLYTAKEGVDWLRRRARAGDRAAKTIEQHFPDWQMNGATPQRLFDFLRQKPWEIHLLSDALALSEEELEAMLLSFGFLRGADGLWRPGEDPVSRFLTDNAEFLIHNPHADRRWLRQYFEQRLDEFVRTGEPPPLSWGELPPTPHGSPLPTLPEDRHRTRELAGFLLAKASQEARFWIREAYLRARRRGWDR